MKILCFEVTFIGFRPRWKTLARRGMYIAAIKEYRDSFLRKEEPLPQLSQAKQVVDEYVAKYHLRSE